MSDIALVNSALSISQVVDQRKLVMSLMKEAMTENTHYGKIPGCGEKPSLLQPGAQLLATTFHLVPSYRIDNMPADLGHISIQVTCELKFKGDVVCEGIGFCSSMESKFRYRNSAPIQEDTGEAVPKTYWDISNGQGKTEANKWLATAFEGQRVSIKKFGTEWRVVRIVGGTDGKVENPNPVDTFNTVLKMGKKRAYVDAVISATACNDLFTQDLEDIRENLSAVDGVFVVETPQLALPEPEKKPDAAKAEKPKKETPAAFDPTTAKLQFAKFLVEKEFASEDQESAFWTEAKMTIGAEKYEDEWTRQQYTRAWEKREVILQSAIDRINPENAIPI